MFRSFPELSVGQDYRGFDIQTRCEAEYVVIGSVIAKPQTLADVKLDAMFGTSVVTERAGGVSCGLRVCERAI
jgi:hypothetical protein